MDGQVPGARTPRERQRLGAQLVFAAERGAVDEALRLLEAGADPAALDDTGSTALLWTARRGGVDLARALLARGAAPDPRDSRGRTALMVALREGHPGVARVLLEAGADPRAVSMEGHTPLHLAAARGDRELAEALLERGAEVDAVDGAGDTPLTLAAVGGHYGLVTWLAERGADLDAAGNGGRTALLHAVMDGRLEPPQRLRVTADFLDRGARAEVQDDHGWTPLMRAAHRGDTGTAQQLLARDARLDTRDDAGQDPFCWAVRGGSREMMELLLKLGADVDSRDMEAATPLHRQMRDPDPETVRFLLDHGADPNAADVRGRTVLRAAVEKQYADIIRLLVERGADPARPGPDGETPRDYALRSGMNEIAHLLRALGGRTTASDAARLGLEGRLDTPDDRGWTPLARAVRARDAGRVQVLLDAGADLEGASEDGVTPLMLAAEGHPGLLETLLRAGADIHARDARGRTPLHHAVTALRPDSVRALLGGGAEVDAADSRGVTPLMLAAEDCGTGVAEALLEAGADLDLRDRHGRTALMHAIRMHRPDLVARYLELGADPALRDEHEHSARDYARDLRDEAMLRLLCPDAAPPAVPETGSLGLGAALELVRSLDRGGEGLAALEGTPGGGFRGPVGEWEVEFQPEAGALALRALVFWGAGELARNPEAEALLSERQLRDGRDLAGGYLELSDDRGPAGTRHNLYLRRDFRDPALPAEEWLAAAGALAAAAQRWRKEQLVDFLEEAGRRMRAARHEHGYASPPPVRAPLPDEARGPGGPHPAGHLMPAEQAVDCDCDVRLHRPVLHGHTGINFRVGACMRCGTVTFAEAMVEEPRPHDVRCVGNRVAEVTPQVLAWLAEWPRQAAGVWQQDDAVYLPAALRCETPEALAAAEQAALAAQRELDRVTRLRQAGFPGSAPPVALSKQCDSFRETWEGLQLTDETDLDTLVRHADWRTWAAPFAHAVLARRPDLERVVLDLVNSPVPSRHSAGLSIICALKLASPGILSLLDRRLKSAPRTERALDPLLNTVVSLGLAARSLRPTLRGLRKQVGDRDYYLGRRLEQVDRHLDEEERRG